MYQYLVTWGIFLVWEIILVVAMVLASQKKVIVSKWCVAILFIALFICSDSISL